VTTWDDEQPHRHGLSIDHGWSDADETPLGGFRSVLFLAAGGLYFGCVWLLSGLAPLPILVSRLRGERNRKSNPSVDALRAATTNVRKTSA
jgi:hypothetical protein